MLILLGWGRANSHNIDLSFIFLIFSKLAVIYVKTQYLITIIDPLARYCWQYCYSTCILRVACMEGLSQICNNNEEPYQLVFEVGYELRRIYTSPKGLIFALWLCESI